MKTVPIAGCWCSHHPQASLGRAAICQSANIPPPNIHWVMWLAQVSRLDYSIFLLSMQGTKTGWSEWFANCYLNIQSIKIIRCFHCSALEHCKKKFQRTWHGVWTCVAILALSVPSFNKKYLMAFMKFGNAHIFTILVNVYQHMDTKVKLQVSLPPPSKVFLCVLLH